MQGTGFEFERLESTPKRQIPVHGMHPSEALMRHRWIGTCLVGLAVFPAHVFAQAERPNRRPGGGGAPPASAAPAAEEKPAERPKAPEADEPPVVTQHQISADGKTLAYSASAGMMPIKNAQGETEAKIFYIAYTLKDSGDAAKRPVMFSFNGGPGSSSVWLHIGALGPKRVVMPSDGKFAAPPFHVQDNDSTWLDKTDLVFIDPVGTGFSRASKPDLTAKFHGLRGDIDSVGEFIRMYLTKTGRWTSPVYLVGESYGTTRAAGLSDHLVEHGVALNGVVLVSSVLNFQTLRFAQGNDLPNVLYLPTYAATAWYHKKLSKDLQARDVKSVVDEARRWADSEYARSLDKGTDLKPEDRAAMIAGVAKYTGLDPDYVDAADGRIEIMAFCKQLLRKEKKTVGRLDSRYVGIDASHTGENLETDPSMAAIRPPYTSAFNAYVRNDLGYKTDLPYHILGEGVGRWDWGTQGQGYADVSNALRNAMAKNPYMKVFVGSGYFDLATPLAATDYTLAHMGLQPEQKANVRVETYDAGHMMYLHEPSLKKLKADVAKFLEDSGTK